MSSISVNTITDASGGATTSINGFTPSVSNMAGRNRIINGAMTIDQRNAGAAVTASGSYAVDRFVTFNTTDGAFSSQQDSSAPVGFVKSLKTTVTTSDSSLTTNQSLILFQKVEGYNFADFGWGTANAKTVTLSFWVRSSLTGTFGGSLRNSGATRSYPFTYTITVADTWEQKSITVAGDTTGTWETDNGVGVIVYWGLGVGPDRSATAGAWASGGYFSATGATSVVGTSGATFYITGVQLEAGSVATPFCPAGGGSYGAELALCQRYYFNYPSGGSAHYGIFLNAYTSTRGFANIFTPVYMRASPTITNTSSNIRGLSLTTIGATTSVSSYRHVGNALCLDVNIASGLSSGSAYLWQPIDVEFSSEL